MDRSWIDPIDFDTYGVWGGARESDDIFELGTEFQFESTTKVSQTTTNSQCPTKRTQ